MEERKKDRRVTRTKGAIREAYLQLFVEKDGEKITVTEIAERANVDRKTVYNYYDNVADIVDELENELLEMFEKEAIALIGERNPHAYFTALNRLFTQNMERCSLLMRSRNMGLAQKIVDFVSVWLQQAIPFTSAHSKEKMTLVAGFVTAGTFSVYHRWFQEGRQSLEEFTAELERLIVGGLNAYLWGNR